MSEKDPTVLGGRYELKRRLARGGMADVFLARDQLLDRQVAVKVLFREFATDPTFVERFRREAQAAANLSHPNIIAIYDWGKEASTYYIVMEYVEGRSLAEVLKARGALTPDRAVMIAAEVAAALGSAHQAGVVHRDIKPGNIILSPGGVVKVGDFGIATAVTSGTQSNLTQTGAVMGTATYFSPEQALGKSVDQRSDLYSLGVVLYEMLTGRPPFTGDSPVAIAYRHVQEAPPPLHTEGGGEVPAALQAITMKLLAKDPDDRYQSAADLQVDLDGYRDGNLKLAAAPVAAAATGAAAATAGAAAVAAPTRTIPAGSGAPPAPPGTTGGYDPDYYDDEYRGRPDRRIWMYAVAVIALLAVLVALLVVILNGLGDDDTAAGGEVAVPSVIGLDRDAAVERLREDGLEVGTITSEERPDVPAGQVIAQSPGPDVRVDSGSTVNLTVAAGPEAVPLRSVLGLEVDEAVRLLTEDGYEVEQNRIPADADPGIVVGQNPDPNQPLAPGETVIIDVSSGPEPVEVPDVTGLPLDEAIETLREAEFTVAPPEEENSAEVPVGLVIRTNPTAGAEAPHGSEITVFVSLGPSEIVVPDVMGQPQADAKFNLEAVGLIPVPDTCLITDPAIQVPGTVIDQSPAGGEIVAPGSSVMICIGVIPDPTPTSPPTPDPTPTTEPPPTEPPPTPTTEPPPTPTTDPGGDDGGGDDAIVSD